MNNKLLFITLLSFFPYSSAISDSVVGQSFIDAIGGSTWGTEAIVIGQKDINRHVVMLRTIQANVRYTSPDIGYTVEDEEIPNDTYRINCKEKTFAIASEADVQWKINNYLNGWRFNFSGKSVINDLGNTTYVHPEMIKTFQKACK